MNEADEIRFFVPGRPVPGGSKRAFAHKSTGKIIVTDDAKGNKAWRDRVASFARDAYSGPPLACALIVTMRFAFLRPKGHFGTGRNRDKVRDSAPPYPAVKPDILKIARSSEDACTGILWCDDAQTITLLLVKLYDVTPGVEIVVRRMEES